MLGLLILLQIFLKVTLLRKKIGKERGDKAWHPSPLAIAYELSFSFRKNKAKTCICFIVYS